MVKVYLPKENQEKYKQIIDSFKHLIKLKTKENLKIDRKEILDLIKAKTRPPVTTTTMSLYILCKNLIKS